MIPTSLVPDIPIYFYSPHYRAFRDDLPATAEASWEWMFERGKSKYHLSDGEYAWTFQTYLWLRAYGFPCELTDTLPQQGIVLAHRIHLPLSLKPSHRLLLICLQADKTPHPFAQISVVLNPLQRFCQYSHLGDVHAPTLRKTHQQPQEHCYFLRHWPIPGLLPRDPSRGERFENVVFFGVGRSLASELYGTTWQQGVKQLGLNWSFRGPGERGSGWKDFRDVDAVVAVRQFGSRDSFAWKPATKLYNAWIAGVPAVLGRESAYQVERQSDLDYLEVDSLESALETLKRLRDEPRWRQAIVANGQRRARAIQPDKLAQAWMQFLTDVAQPTYEAWCSKSGLSRAAYQFQREGQLLDDRLRRFWQFKQEGLQRRLQALGQANQSG